MTDPAAAPAPSTPATPKKRGRPPGAKTNGKKARKPRAVGFVIMPAAKAERLRNVLVKLSERITKALEKVDAALAKAE